MSQYCVAYAVNAMKSRIMRTYHYPMHATVERIRIISYMEAVIDAASPIITSSWMSEEESKLYNAHITGFCVI